MELCAYGCNQEAKYTTKGDKKPICSKYPCQCPVIRAKNSKGLERAHKEGKLNGWGGSKNKKSWNEGLSTENSEKVKGIGEKISGVISELHKNGNIQKSWKDKNLPEEMKLKISESMKIAHKEGRAWNIGKSRWNNEPSYPEKFFMKVIENEFENKNYKTEYPVDVFAIDFAWPNKKLAIEIDGKQHKRFKEYRERDKRKNLALENEGWKLLRIEWKSMYHNSKKWIKIAKDFIDNN